LILLDTNVLSALMRSPLDPGVRAWMDRQPESSIWTTSLTILELRSGVLLLPQGRRRAELVAALDAVLAQDIEGRIASFDAAAAEHAAALDVLRRTRGRVTELRDTMIAGIALATKATLATRNIGHFADLAVPVVNPWEG